jgi:pSer/pThr/pTyr-binding forkhead associated (FHA) protein/ketosteroid isomerase-like protein
MASHGYQLVMREGPVPGDATRLVKSELTIGRVAKNDIVIDDTEVSRNHARLISNGDGYIIEDLGSTNGTFVNGKKLSGQQALRAGDTINLGKSIVLIYQSLGNDLEATVVSSGPAVTARIAMPVSTAEEHREMFERWFEELWNKKNYSITQELVHPDFTAHGAGGQDIKQGPNGVADMVRTWHTAFPDGKMTMDDIITEGEFSVIRMTFRGTHTGDFYGNPPSGNKVEVTSIGIDRVVDGKITEGWGELNMLGLMQQIGAIPGPGAGGPGPDGMYEIDTEITQEHVLAAYDALASGDINRIQEYWDETMVWQVPGHNELSGWYLNRDEFLAFMGRVGELSGGSFKMEPIAGQVLVTGEYSVDLTRNRGNRADMPEKTMDIEVAHVLRWRAGKVIAGKGAIFGDGAEEYNQFWSRSPAVTPSTH